MQQGYSQPQPMHPIDSSHQKPKALPLLPTMSHRNKQVDLPPLRGRGAMVKARHPLLVFSRVSLTVMRPFLLLSLLALAAKTGGGGKKQALLPMPLLPPTGGGGGTQRKFNSTATVPPAAKTKLTGARVMG